MNESSPSANAPRAPSAEDGFSLIEVLITVVIITVIAAIALPVLRNGMKDRRTRQTAEEIARVFRDARLRAVGRGSAVVVHYVNSSSARSFEIREAVAGPPPNAAATCNRLPATSCLQANWSNVATNIPVLGSQVLETYTFNDAADATGIKVFLGLPAAPDSDITEFSVCFTPLGRTYAVSGPPVFSNSTVLTSAPRFRVWRTDPGGTQRIGLERRVVLLPNGQARLQTAGSP